MEELSKDTDKFESLYSFICYDTTIDSFISWLYKTLELIDKSRDDVKRKYLNDRIYSMITFIKDEFKPEDDFNYVFLLGKTIHKFILTKKQILNLRNYQIKNIWFANGEYYNIEAITDLLNNTEHYEVLQVQNNKLIHQQMTKYKIRTHFVSESKELNLQQYLDDNKITKAVLYGVSSHLKKFKNDEFIVVNKNLTHMEILDCFFKDKMLKLHNKLKEDLLLISNEKTTDRIKVGNNLSKALENSSISTLYLTSKMFNRMTKKFSHLLENVKNIYVIEKIENGDISDTLDKDYSGAYGITYF